MQLIFLDFLFDLFFSGTQYPALLAIILLIRSSKSSRFIVKCKFSFACIKKNIYGESNDSRTFLNQVI
ncbi:hypothetical protein B1J93_08895 [Leptospira kirschneri serovar Pomona]|uniref:Uncharacterized protein n=1 Tax=Leptospira kirschneri serovar Pomona TaxID=561005 RepID=A0A1T1DQE9_9LEPT|nr:hypothetical protein B1J93_08895 [Leptospira kirschneri serovar Pomona]